jgi:hypothetical protein
MHYDLMLLADPGTDRERVCETLNTAPDLTPDPALDNRYWLKTPNGDAQVNIGTKDPVESIHVEFEFGEPAFMEQVARRTLELGAALDMRVEDCQWGHEVTPENVTQLHNYWAELRRRKDAPAAAEEPSRPWWRLW